MTTTVQVGQRVFVAYIDEFEVTGKVAVAYTNYRKQPAFVVELDRPLHVYGVFHKEVSVSPNQILEVINCIA